MPFELIGFKIGRNRSNIFRRRQGLVQFVFDGPDALGCGPNLLPDILDILSILEFFLSEEDGAI